MREYIITDKQLKTATEAYLEHELSRPITDVFISGDKLPEIVRCRDCKHFSGWSCEKSSCSYCGEPQRVEPNGFCSRGERRTDDNQ